MSAARAEFDHDPPAPLASVVVPLVDAVARDDAGRVLLSRADCLRLMAATALGRVVFTDAAMPAVRPVTFVLDGDEAVFRVPHGGPLDAATHGAVVGFQVDAIDHDTHVGWSVVGIGRAYEVTAPGRRGGLPAGWDADGTAHTVAVPLEQLSGERIRLD
ncbi:pyridoxamine 5'-phosphate oxidase family protein [Pseudonocardia abyssalis]|uniref:Pyridoxamine 5'-phosphate oxidase family protein n=1 Tax=Pseudonocardia abyssalis TaxID=2792008 RepID=A0ABS6USA6_9PSEU|nr:pyridoxamine 5'-phosphate oxidase family protein [Pseudonocardia abyssalis]MBW0113874.1 pyridoxamine 5'-phosphate oxidase family protein [Pseudonocardia abyssalis]MBW0135129.1 pyridoxamine 5'-phosphate oxidase family protein [Pseudonocardia abyssalis]